jgi:hypothetical protein
LGAIETKRPKKKRLINKNENKTPQQFKLIEVNEISGIMKIKQQQSELDKILKNTRRQKIINNLQQK